MTALTFDYKTTTATQLYKERNGKTLSTFGFFRAKYAEELMRKNQEIAVNLAHQIGIEFEKDSDITYHDCVLKDDKGNPLVVALKQYKQHQLNPKYAVANAREITRSIVAFFKYSNLDRAKAYMFTLSVEEKKLLWGFDYKQMKKRLWKKARKLVDWIAKAEVGEVVFIRYEEALSVGEDGEIYLYPHLNVCVSADEARKVWNSSLNEIRKNWRKITRNPVAMVHNSGSMEQLERRSMYVLKHCDLTKISQRPDVFKWLYEGCTRTKNFMAYGSFKDFLDHLKDNRQRVAGSIGNPVIRQIEDVDYHAREPKKISLSEVVHSSDASSFSECVVEGVVRDLASEYSGNIIMATVSSRPIARHMSSGLYVYKYNKTIQGDKGKQRLADIETQLQDMAKHFYKNAPLVNIIDVMAERKAMEQVVRNFINVGIKCNLTEEEFNNSIYNVEFSYLTAKYREEFKSMIDGEEPITPASPKINPVITEKQRLEEILNSKQLHYISKFFEKLAA